MAEKEKTIQVEVKDQPVKITVARATAKRGVMRYRLMATDNVNGDADLNYIQMYVYPNIMAGTVAVEGMEWPITGDALADLDEELVNTWIEAVYEVNPNWEPKAQTQEQVEKKE